MEPHHELWLTALFNDYLAGVAMSILHLFGQHAHNPERPWANFMVMQILVAVILMVLFAVLRPRLSMDRPGKLQHLMEVIYGFIREQADEQIGHTGHKYAHYAGTLFFFILFSNLLGVIPSFESPTMFTYVPLGCALATFLYYNGAGMAAQGVGKYLSHFAGPMLPLAPLMVPIEIISNCARPLSLTVRLYANMLAGEKVTLVFISLTYVVVPALFMGLHVFVSFLQAYVFMLLTMVYISGAVEKEEH